VCVQRRALYGEGPTPGPSKRAALGLAPKPGWVGGYENERTRVRSCLGCLCVVSLCVCMCSCVCVCVTGAAPRQHLWCGKAARVSRRSLRHDSCALSVGRQLDPASFRAFGVLFLLLGGGNSRCTRKQAREPAQTPYSRPLSFSRVATCDLLVAALSLSLSLSLAVESSPSALDSFALDLETVVVLLVSIDHFHM